MHWRTASASSPWPTRSNLSFGIRWRKWWTALTSHEIPTKLHLLRIDSVRHVKQLVIGYAAAAHFLQYVLCDADNGASPARHQGLEFSGGTVTQRAGGGPSLSYRRFFPEPTDLVDERQSSRPCRAP